MKGQEFVKISSEIAVLSSVTGDYYGLSKSLALAGTGFLTESLVVTFTHSGVDRQVTVTPSSDTAATVTTPAALDSAVSSGDTVTVKVTNSDGSSSSGVDITVLVLPSGGTVTTSGSYRIHTFTSSGTFTNTLSLTNVEYLVIAGGGAGAAGQ